MKELGIEIKAYAKAIAGIEVSKDHFDFAEMNNNPFNMPDKEAAKLVQEKADQMIKEMDSIGGIIECQITGMPVGIGETVFDNIFRVFFNVGLVLVVHQLNPRIVLRH